MAAASAIGLTLTAAVGAIAANTSLLGTASSAGPVVRAVATVWVALYALPFIATAVGLIYLFFFH